jgi:alpha-glucosidase
MTYTANRPESHGVFRDWRKIAEGYRPPRLLLGETWVGDLGKLAGFYGHDDELQLAFNFPFVFARFGAQELSDVVGATLTRLPAGACPVWTASNHDVGRFPTRWCEGDERKIRLALLVLVTLPGTTVLYYGDEIGMTDVRVPPELRRDHMSRQGASRDRARTPMQWDASASAGFTADGVTPWLPVGDAATRNVADQRDDPASVLRFCRSLLALRRAELGGMIAPCEMLATAEGQWAYRVGGLVVAANLSDEPAARPAEAGEILLATAGEPPPAGRPLGPWEGVIARTRRPAAQRSSADALGRPGRDDVYAGPTSLARSAPTSLGPNPCSESHCSTPPYRASTCSRNATMVCALGVSSTAALGLLLMSSAYVLEPRSRSRIASIRSAVAM